MVKLDHSSKFVEHYRSIPPDFTANEEAGSARNSGLKSQSNENTGENYLMQYYSKKFSYTKNLAIAFFFVLMFYMSTLIIEAIK